MKYKILLILLLMLSFGNVYALSNNSKLSSLYLSQGEFKFDSDQKSYVTIVDNSVSSVNITATILDKTAKFVTNYGPRKVDLKVGTNTIQVKVQAEDNTISTYTINVIRSDGSDANNKLINIELSVGKINFNPDVYSYSFGVDSNVNEIDVKAVSESPLAAVELTDINGKKSNDKITSKLKVGTNKILINVSAESKEVQTYQLNITRENYNSEDNYLESLYVKNYNLNFKKDVFKYDLNIKNEKSLVITPKTEKTSATYTITGNENLVDGSKISVVVSDIEGSTREYIINVHIQEDNAIIKWIILGVEALIILILLIIIIAKKNKNRPRKPKRAKIISNRKSSTVRCKMCNAVNDIKSKTCYVCGNKLR